MISAILFSYPAPSQIYIFETRKMSKKISRGKCRFEHVIEQAIILFLVLIEFKYLIFGIVFRFTGGVILYCRSVCLQVN